MILTPSQTLIAQDLHRFRVVDCGRRFGKTTLAVEEMKGKALAKPSRIAYIAPTFQQARDIAWETLLTELKPIIISANGSRLELRVKTIDDKESLIILRGWEAIETLRGQKFDFIVVDEIASMRNFLSMWQEVVRPTLTDNKGEGLFISTPKGYNHFYELFCLDPTKSKAFEEQIQDKDFKSFQFTTYDNPHIPPEEVDKAREELTEDRFAQEYLADFRKTEGLVYKEFDRDKHLYSSEELDDRRIVQTIGGLDFGHTNPCALLTIKIDSDSNYWVDSEFYQTGKTEDEIAEIVASTNLNKVYPDPESPSSIKALKRRGVNVREVVKNKDSIKNGINVIRELFKSGRLKINKNCINTIWELETYSYPEKKDLHNEEENPIKENDHAMDALRYPLFMIEFRNQGTAHQFVPGSIDRNAIYQPTKVAHQFIPKF